LREITQKKEEKFVYPENQKTTVTIVLKALSDIYGKPFRDYTFNTTGQVKNFLQLLINGINIITLKGQETTLQDGDVLAILPPVCGG
jgi:MoaD family protein